MTMYTVPMHALKTASLSTLFFCVSVMPAYAATLYLEPDVGTYGPGDTFIANVRLDTEGECINAANVELQYPTGQLRAVDFSKGDSIFSLWIGDPEIDIAQGTVRFQGGVPGGYCGRISGDPSLSNIIGKVVFSVITSEPRMANISIGSGSMLYLNNGFGTEVVPVSKGATITLAPERTTSEDPWLVIVQADNTPPDNFQIIVESTQGVFGGKYYAVFSTVDKQSGLDHYEIFERGVWTNVTSPHELKDQSLKGGVQIKAIDKAGNERHGEYIEGSAPPRQYSSKETLYSLLIAGVLMLIVVYELYRRRKIALKKATEQQEIELVPPSGSS